MSANKISSLIMQNLPLSQGRVNLDVLANDVFLDAQSLGRQVDLHGVIGIIKELHKNQDLFIFRDGTVAATRKGLNHYG